MSVTPNRGARVLISSHTPITWVWSQSDTARITEALTDVQVEYALKTTQSMASKASSFVVTVFKNFVEAGGLWCCPCRVVDHHQLGNVYNQVTIRLSTHDADGLTEKDLQLAGAIDSVFP